jgi:Ca2+-binding EF-hand superfamily protein
MGVGSSISLHKASSCEVTAGKLFDDMDTSGDGQLTVVELYDATMRYGEEISAHWTLERIKTTIDRFDADSDGRLRKRWPVLR